MTRALTVLVGVGAIAAPLLADPVLYTFDLTSGSLTWQTSDSGSTTSGMLGTFAITVYQSDGHIGESDTFVLEDSMLANTEWMRLFIGGVATASIGPYGTEFDDMPGDFRLLDFVPVGPGHIGPGGQSTIDTDIYAVFGMNITGAFDTPFFTSSWSAEVGSLNLGFGTSLEMSDVLTVSLAGTYKWVTAIFSVGQTVTHDFIFEVTGTAHVVPDPALGGLVAMGLGGAGAWLRRRRDRSVS